MTYRISLKYHTNVGLTAASVAYGTYGIGKGLWSLGRGILSGTSEISAVARTGATAQRATTASKAAALPEGHMWQRCSPFKDKTAAELHEMFLKKGFEAKGKDFLGYIQPIWLIEKYPITV